MKQVDLQLARSTASRHRRVIFRTLLALPHDEKYLGYMLTKKAKELGLVGGDRPTLKGHTISEWAESRETDGRNAPNAWACTAAIHVILDYSRRFSLSEEEITTFAFYLNPKIGDDDAFFQAKALITNTLVASH
jgi:hypothetical protein